MDGWMIPTNCTFLQIAPQITVCWRKIMRSKQKPIRMPSNCFKTFLCDNKLTLISLNIFSLTFSIPFREFRRQLKVYSIVFNFFLLSDVKLARLIIWRLKETFSENFVRNLLDTGEFYMKKILIQCWGFIQLKSFNEISYFEDLIRFSPLSRSAFFFKFIVSKIFFDIVLYD